MPRIFSAHARKQKSRIWRAGYGVGVAVRAVKSTAESLHGKSMAQKGKELRSLFRRIIQEDRLRNRNANIRAIMDLGHTRESANEIWEDFRRGWSTRELAPSIALSRRTFWQGGFFKNDNARATSMRLRERRQLALKHLDRRAEAKKAKQTVTVRGKTRERPIYVLGHLGRAA
jgi:hypothetical protein